MNMKMVSAAVVAAMVSLGIVAAQNRPGTAPETAKASARSQFVAWSKVRLDEIDATLAACEAQIDKLKGDARAKAESAVANMRAKRDAFRLAIKNEVEQIETDWNREKAAREADWKVFEANAQKYIDDAHATVEEQKAAFQARAEAQQKAWKEAIDKLERDSAKATAESKAKVDAVIKQMKADAKAAQAKLDKLQTASASAWSAYEKALEETRATFDHANQQAHDAFSK
jgi:hypothetical protein